MIVTVLKFAIRSFYNLKVLMDHVRQWLPRNNVKHFQFVLIGKWGKKKTKTKTSKPNRNT